MNAIGIAQAQVHVHICTSIDSTPLSRRYMRLLAHPQCALEIYILVLHLSHLHNVADMRTPLHTPTHIYVSRHVHSALHFQ